MTDDMYVVIVTAQPPDQLNVLKTVAAYVTDEPCRALELKADAERVTGGTACINKAPFVHVPDSMCFTITDLDDNRMIEVNLKDCCYTCDDSTLEIYYDYTKYDSGKISKFADISCTKANVCAKYAEVDA